MRMWSRLLCLSLLFTLSSATNAQLPPDKALAAMSVADGLQIELFASEPLFVNPTCMDIDHKGRVWVCESVNYRNKLRGQKKLNREEGDRIVILEDTKGTGQADKATTFYQAPDFIAPLGIAVAKDATGPGYKVCVCHSPDLLLFEDKDGDGQADGSPTKLLSGFGGFDHDHGIHGILIGPDGKLYFSVGDQGVKNLKGRGDNDKKVWNSNSTDCRAGTVWRCDLDGKNLELLAHNFRNNYEPCVDSFGSVFISDNDDDGNQQTRICYVMPGGNYGYHPRGPGQTHWHEEQPGVVPKILRTYFGSPTGMCVYEGTLLPKKYWGQLLHTEAGPRHLRCYHLKPNGAGYDAEQENMVESKDNWFRPSDVCVAPDGSVFVADWYDPGVGGHGMGDTTRGRIYRITPKGHRRYQVPKAELESADGVLAALRSPCLATRALAIGHLLTEGKTSLKVLAQGLESKDEVLVARSLWLYHQIQHKHGSLETFGPLLEFMFRKTDSKEFGPMAVRLAHAVQGVTLASYKYDPKLVAKLTGPEFTAANREALLVMRDAEPEKVKPYLYALAKQYDGKDRFYLAAVGIAVGHHDKARREVILADFTKHFPELDEKTLDLVWELRPPSVVPALEKRLADVKLAPAQRKRIVDILASADDPIAGKVLLNVLQSDVPQDVRDQVLENLKLFLPGKWRDLRKSNELTQAIDSLLSKPPTRATALTLIGVAERAEAIDKVAMIARNVNELVAVRSTAIKTLGQLPPAEAVAALDSLLSAEPASLRLEVVQALGQHTMQRKEKPDTVPALKALQKVLFGKEHDLPLKQATVEALAASRHGTQWLLDAHGKKELPQSLVADIGRALRNTPYQDLRSKALIAFPAPGKLDPKKLPQIAALVARKGNAERGKQLLATSVKNDTQCLKCHTVRGFGGSIGPDLSMIGKKASRDNLFESLLHPSKAIADQYLTWQVVTKQGLALSGLIVEETPDYVLVRDANGKDTKIDKKDIAEREKSPNSLMPNDLLAYLTEEDLVDMVDYLFGLKTPALVLDYWHIAGPFANGANDAGLDQVFPPEKGVDLKATYAGKAGQVAWRTVKPNSQSYVDLQAFLAPDSKGVASYVYREIESPVDQDAVILLGTDDAAKLWVNDGLVYTNRKHRSAAPEEDGVAVKLKKGRNKILLKITNGDGPHGFYLTIVTEQELKRLETK